MAKFGLRTIQQWLDEFEFPHDWALIGFGAIIGSLTGLAAYAFFLGLDKTAEFCTQTSNHWIASWTIWMVPILPMLGALATGVLIETFARDGRGHGVPQVIDAIARKSGFIPLRVGFIKAIASICTVGSGGSAGAEGPIVHIGSTVGSVCGRALNASRMDMGTLVACGGGAGIAAIFNAPITGVFFAIEILLRDFSLKSVTPVIVASAFATAIMESLLPSNQALFAVIHLNYVFSLKEIPSYFVLGIVCAVVSVAFTKLMHWIENFFHRLKTLPYFIKPLIGAILLGLLGVGWVYLMPLYSGPKAVPSFFGNGYQTVRALIQPNSYVAGATALPGVTGALGSSATSIPPILISVAILLTVFKTLGTTLTLGSGGSGGVFAPGLYIGASTGAAFGLILAHIGLMPAGASAASYALVGMSAVIAGTSFAPFTGIFLLLEVTHEPVLLLPAMICAIIAAVVCHLWMGESIYTARLREEGVLLGGGRDLTVMRRILAADVEVSPLPAEPIYPSDPLSKLIALHMPRTCPDFVVVDEHGEYLGMVTGDDLRTALVDREAIPLLLVAELLRDDIPTIQPDETLDTVMDKFAREHHGASLCIMSSANPKRPAGLVTRSNVISRYQQALEES